MQELQNFVYELQRYADQTHTLKDAFEKLSETEKELVMNVAPPRLKAPNEYFQPVYEWLEAIHRLRE
ncbi:hypothetical protein [Oceanobacillus profundus]|uniref:Uncharacterized protein n=1 Tax=Oceanobacillus profundus TaxID=372463 RepID=A0A417YKG9_9BACI|nr:hypothetical protein [Oceanobacillus profundus]MBR3120025.1 hypothetical protein [Oceanobacillus sp.]PAE30169.1 hypothetical protein CHI07_05360 [Paenibacillus sp. 7884-2]MCM3397034.1 hypothetical protein [Oceanobacillus profundus]MDO6449810.1 hypothetical protein [Oceanobacillus profundus]RHW33807.1 hypothetical protein D1B32_07120 [Oceanobacillus profundus]